MDSKESGSKDAKGAPTELKGPIKLKKAELLQEGSFQANSVLKFFKMACLSFKASPIPYRNAAIPQKELFEMRDSLLLNCQDLLAA